MSVEVNLSSPGRLSAYSQHWCRFTWLSLLLLPLSLCYCLLTEVRRLCYRLGVLAQASLEKPVIVIGNITVGGTGKTPLVIWLAQYLQGHGYRPGIIARGYRGRAKSWPQSVGADTDVDLVGDEAVLLARQGACPVAVGPNRIASARVLIDKHGCDVIISDDGLQHYALGRTIEIAVIDGQRRFGNGLCLPAGPLRERVGRLQTIDVRITNGLPRKGELGMATHPEAFINLKERANHKEPTGFAGEHVHAVAGIGNPDRFYSQLETLNITLERHTFPDHYHYRERDIRFADNRAVIMTEKDAVKCEQFATANDWYLAIKAEPEPMFGQAILTRLQEDSDGQKTT